MRYFLIAYDICDEKRLNRVRKIAYSYALSGQKSAVEAPLDRNALRQLIAQLESVIDEETDKINIIPIKGEPLIFGKGEFVSNEKGVWFV
jgi:CRISPR-associated protein Cas2